MNFVYETTLEARSCYDFRVELKSWLHVTSFLGKVIFFQKNLGLEVLKEILLSGLWTANFPSSFFCFSDPCFSSSVSNVRATCAPVFFSTFPGKFVPCFEEEPFHPPAPHLELLKKIGSTYHYMLRTWLVEVHL